MRSMRELETENILPKIERALEIRNGYPGMIGVEYPKFHGNSRYAPINAAIAVTSTIARARMRRVRLSSNRGYRFPDRNRGVTNSERTSFCSEPKEHIGQTVPQAMAKACDND